MSNRQSYTAKVQALLSLNHSAEQRADLIKDIVSALDKAAKGVKEAAKKEEEGQVRTPNFAADNFLKTDLNICIFTNCFLSNKGQLTGLEVKIAVDRVISFCTH